MKLPGNLPWPHSLLTSAFLLTSSPFPSSPHSPFLASFSLIIMKIINLHPPFFPTKKSKKKSKSCQSISRSDPPSFGSTETTISSEGSISLRDQTISKQELEAVLRRLEVTEEEVTAMLAESTGRYNIVKMEQADEAELREAFGVFDTDGDGRISAEELQEMLVMLGDEHCTLGECQSMIQMVDQGGDGFVCFGDFVRMMDGGWR